MEVDSHAALAVVPSTEPSRQKDGIKLLVLQIVIGSVDVSIVRFVVFFFLFFFLCIGCAVVHLPQLEQACLAPTTANTP